MPKTHTLADAQGEMLLPSVALDQIAALAADRADGNGDLDPPTREFMRKAALIAARMMAAQVHALMVSHFAAVSHPLRADLRDLTGLDPRISPPTPSNDPQDPPPPPAATAAGG